MSDLISRQAAIDALLDELMEKPERYEDGLDRHDIEAVLGSLPPVHPQPKTGKWMLGVSLWYCSECGSSYSYNDYTFCPNCGANMKR